MSKRARKYSPLLKDGKSIHYAIERWNRPLVSRLCSHSNYFQLRRMVMTHSSEFIQTMRDALEVVMADILASHHVAMQD
jgi:hypothetical protein